MNKAIERLGEHLNTPINEYTVKGISEGPLHSHQWYISCDDPLVKPEQAAALLDQYLIELNDDYATERKHALKRINVKLLPSSVFLGWMQEQGKYGSQSKFPRVLVDSKYKEWLHYLETVKDNTVIV